MGDEELESTEPKSGDAGIHPSLLPVGGLSRIRSLSSSGNIAGIPGELNPNLASMRDELVQARERMRAAIQAQQQPQGPDPRMMAVAAALMGPTRSGSIGENFSNATTGYAGADAAQRDRALKLAQADYGLSEQGYGDELKSTAMGVNLLKAVSKGMGGNRAVSTLGKLAADMGHEPGSPGFNATVQRLAKEDADNKGLGDIEKWARGLGLNPDSPEYKKFVAEAYARKDARERQAIDLQRADISSRNMSTNLRAQELADLRERGNIAPDPALASQFGVPVTKSNPYGMLSPKARETFFANESKAFQKESEKLMEKNTTAAAKSQQADRFLTLNDTTKTGGIYAVPVLGPTASTLKIAAGNNELGEMQSIAIDLSRHLRQPGEGAMSDFDAKQLAKSTVGITNPYETNKNIAAVIKAGARNEQDYVKFKHEYFLANRTTQGSDLAWKDYLNANPILDPTKKEGYALNTKRKSYKEYFYAPQEEVEKHVFNPATKKWEIQKVKKDN